jgi:hypothetical protein
MIAGGAEAMVDPFRTYSSKAAKLHGSSDEIALESLTLVYNRVERA